jgi:hypothetical protein
VVFLAPLDVITETVTFSSRIRQRCLAKPTVVDYSKSTSNPSGKKETKRTANQLTQGATFLPTEEISRHVALAKHLLPFMVRWMFVVSFGDVRPCGGRDSAARRKDE